MNTLRFILNIRPFLFVSIVLILSGCIEIVEDITIHNDKSGTFQYRIETSQGGSFLQNLTRLIDVSVEDQFRFEAEKFISELETQPGISNIHYNLNGRSGSYFLQFDFSDYKSFNNTLYAINGSKKTIFTPGYIKIGKSRFKKINLSPWLKMYIEKEHIEFPSPLLGDMITYKAIVHVPDEINRIKPGDTFIDRSQRKTIQQFRFKDILEGKVNTGIKIRY